MRGKKNIFLRIRTRSDLDLFHVHISLYGIIHAEYFLLLLHILALPSENYFNSCNGYAIATNGAFSGVH